MEVVVIVAFDYDVMVLRAERVLSFLSHDHMVDWLCNEGFESDDHVTWCDYDGQTATVMEVEDIRVGN